MIIARRSGSCLADLPFASDSERRSKRAKEIGVGQRCLLNLEAAVARNIQVITSRQSPSCERLSTDRKAHEKFRLTDDEDNPARLIPMYEIEVIVTTLTRTELKLTANWPLFWLQAPGSIEILRKLLPGETVPRLKESAKRSEFPVNSSVRSNLQLGDRLIVRCFFKGESLG